MLVSGQDEPEGAKLTSNGTRFLSAFNEIEELFRSKLGADQHVDFAQLESEYGDKYRLPVPHRNALRAFRELRNAIVHGRYFGGRPIAEPVPEVVDEIEHLRSLLMSPPTALAVLGIRDVCVARCEEPIRTALEYVRQFDYSQLPVYDGKEYVGILTTNTIARWLAQQLTTNQGLAEEEAVRQVLTFAEAHERALLVPRTITAAEAIHKLSHGGAYGIPITALIVTERGLNRETPFRVIAFSDLPQLTAALTIT
jgi:predicted transcriptional regulator